MNILKGKLSYTLAALSIIGGLAGYILGITDASTTTSMVWGGLALFGIRRAI